MNEILFIRHAETDMAGTFCGHSDPDLNVRGRAQLAGLVEELRGENLGSVYTSDLRRARATGMAIADAFGVGCHVRPALRELDFGQWEGLRWEEIEERDKAYSCDWIAAYPRMASPGGEDIGRFERRVLEEVEFLSIGAEREARTIAVVTHAGVIRTVLCSLHGCSEETAWEQTKDYCCVVRHPILGSFGLIGAGVKLAI